MSGLCSKKTLLPSACREDRLLTTNFAVVGALFYDTVCLCSLRRSRTAEAANRLSRDIGAEEEARGRKLDVLSGQCPCCPGDCPTSGPMSHLTLGRLSSFLSSAGSRIKLSCQQLRLAPLRAADHAAASSLNQDTVLMTAGGRWVAAGHRAAGPISFINPFLELAAEQLERWAQ